MTSGHNIRALLILVVVFPWHCLISVKYNMAVYGNFHQCQNQHSHTRVVKQLERDNQSHIYHRFKNISAKADGYHLNICSCLFSL